MSQNVGVRAASFFEGVGKDGEAVESAVVVDALGQGTDSAGQPRQINGDRAKGVAHNVSNKVCLLSFFIRVCRWTNVIESLSSSNFGDGIARPETD
jgi:hypothetical protein